MRYASFTFLLLVAILGGGCAPHTASEVGGPDSAREVAATSQPLQPAGADIQPFERETTSSGQAPPDVVSKAGASQPQAAQSAGESAAQSARSTQTETEVDPSETTPEMTESAAAEATESPADDGQLKTLVPGLRIVPRGQVVEIDGTTCLDSGWLEQIACSPNTREHESLVVITVKPAAIHAAMLAAGFEAGEPGRWYVDDQNRVRLSNPTGDKVAIDVRYSTETDGEQEHPIRDWIVAAANQRAFPSQPWVFGGSEFAQNPPAMGPGEHYVADMTGSIIGLVTFGDEVLGLQSVIPDQVDVHEAVWQANPATMPPPGTPVTLIITLWTE